MSVERVVQPTSIHELARYVEREHPRLRTLLNGQHEQLVVVGQPGHPEPPAALREIIGSSGFKLRDETADSRGRWLGVINAADDGGDR